MPVPLEVRLVKGQRKVCIHFFVHDAKGPISTAQRVEIAPMMAPVFIGGARGFVACQPQRKVIGGQMNNGRAQLFPVTAEVPATTCLECIATEWFKKSAQELADMISKNG